MIKKFFSYFTTTKLIATYLLYTNYLPISLAIKKEKTLRLMGGGPMQEDEELPAFGVTGIFEQGVDLGFTRGRPTRLNFMRPIYP